MNYRSLVSLATGWLKQNSQVVLTGIAVGGAVSTAILSFRAGQEYQAILEDEALKFEMSNDTERKTRREIAIENWHLFIAPVASVGLTVAAIITGHSVSMRKQGAVAAALAISEKTLHDYRGKVAELVSPRKAEEVEEQIITDRIKEKPPWDSEIVKVGNGQTLCYDTYTGRYFQSTRQQIENAVNMLNHTLNADSYASLNEFYGHLGLASVNAGEDLGWNDANLLEVKFTSHLADDDQPCLAVSFRNMPKPYFWKA